MEIRDVDVLVLGGGMAGIFAAIGARNPPASVVIVEPSNVLGGQGTTGGVAGFVGDTQHVNDIFRTLLDRLAACGKIDPYRPNDDRRAYDLETCAFLLQELVTEAGVEIWLHAAALDVTREGTAIVEVLVRCGPTTVRVRPKIVIDATGNAIISSMAGAETEHLGARQQLPMSLYFTLWDTHRPVHPFLPPGCPKWDSSDDLPMTSLHAFADGRIEVKMKVVGFDAADGFSLSQAEIHARRQMMGLIYHLQTRGYQGRHSFNQGKPLSTFTLASVARAIGQREGRRIVGRTRLTEHDVRSACVFEDAVAVGTYHLDYHWPDTEKRAGTGVTDMVEPYHIPLSAMRPAALDNVLCPGRSLSGDQLALSSYRAMATCAQMGLGAGTAAALAIGAAQPLDAIDLIELKRRLAVRGQSLNLSDYGDYLRCLRHIEETVPLSRRPGANEASQLSLLRAPNGKTCAIRYDRETGQAEIALRCRASWRPAARPDAANNQAGLPDPDLPLLVPVNLAQHFEIAFGAEGFPLTVDRPLPQSPHASFATAVAICELPPSRVCLATCPVLADPPSTMLIALLLDGLTGGASHYLVVDRDIDPSSRPALIHTAIGIALLYDRSDGSTRFFEGSIERFAPIGQPPPSEPTLQALPYTDHIILSA